MRPSNQSDSAASLESIAQAQSKQTHSSKNTQVCTQTPHDDCHVVKPSVDKRHNGLIEVFFVAKTGQVTQRLCTWIFSIYGIAFSVRLASQLFFPLRFVRLTLLKLGHWVLGFLRHSLCKFDLRL